MSSRKMTLRDISPIPFLASMVLTFVMSHSPVSAAPAAGSASDNAAMARPVTTPTVPPPTTPNINAIPSTTTGTPNSVSQPTSGAINDNAKAAGDTSLTQQVRSSLNGGQVSPESARGIQVQTVNGVVTLSGTVSSQAEADRAAAAARSASGKDVTNNITVQQK